MTSQHGSERINTFIINSKLVTSRKVLPISSFAVKPRKSKKAWLQRTNWNCGFTITVPTGDWSNVWRNISLLIRRLDITCLLDSSIWMVSTIPAHEWINSSNCFAMDWLYPLGRFANPNTPPFYRQSTWGYFLSRHFKSSPGVIPSSSSSCPALFSLLFSSSSASRLNSSAYVR